MNVLIRNIDHGKCERVSFLFIAGQCIQPHFVSVVNPKLLKVRPEKSMRSGVIRPMRQSHCEYGPAVDSGILGVHNEGRFHEVSERTRSLCHHLLHANSVICTVLLQLVSSPALLARRNQNIIVVSLTYLKCCLWCVEKLGSTGDHFMKGLRGCTPCMV